MPTSAPGSPEPRPVGTLTLPAGDLGPDRVSHPITRPTAPYTTHPVIRAVELSARRVTAGGFTLLELLVVVSIVALATAGVSLSLRDASATQLEREGQRMAALLESARAQSRTLGVPLYWRAMPNGFEIGGQFRQWLTPGTQATLATLASRSAQSAPQLVLGPEPLLPPQRMALSLQGRTLWLNSDGLRPFQVSSAPPGATP